MGLNTFVKNSSYVFCARILTTILASGSMIFLVRYLGPDRLGVYSFVITLLFLFATFSDPGISACLIKEMSQDRKNIQMLFSNHFSVQLVITVTVIVMLLLSTFLISSGVIRTMVTIGLIGLVFNNFIFPFATVLTAMEDMKFNTISALYGGIVTVVIIFVGIYFKCDLKYFMLLSIFPSLITVCCVIWFSRKYIKIRMTYDLKFAKQLLRSSLPFFALTASGLLYSRIDLLMLKILDSNSAAGLYNASYKILFLLFVFPIAVRSAIYPMLSNYHANKQDKVMFVVSKSIKFLVLFATLITGIIFLESHPIIVILFGPKFAPSIYCLRLLIWMFVPYCAYIVTMFHLNSGGSIKYVMKVSLLGLLINVLLNLCLIPTNSIYGAAIATVITEVIVLVGLSLKTFKEYSETNKGLFFIKLIIISISGILISSLFPICFRGLFFTLYFTCSVLLMRLINKKEKEILLMVWDSFLDKFRKDEDKKSIL